MRREDIKLVINKRSPTGAITPNTWHVRARSAQFEQTTFCFLNIQPPRRPLSFSQVCTTGHVLEARSFYPELLNILREIRAHAHANISKIVALSASAAPAVVLLQQPPAAEDSATAAASQQRVSASERESPAAATPAVAPQTLKRKSDLLTPSAFDSPSPADLPAQPAHAAPLPLPPTMPPAALVAAAAAAAISAPALAPSCASAPVAPRPEWLDEIGVVGGATDINFKVLSREQPDKVRGCDAV